MSILSIAQSADEAIKVFRTFQEGTPDLIPTGFPQLDERIGGLFPGTTMVIGGDTGVGKSTILLYASQNVAAQKISTGIISLEDTPDVFGSRALSYFSGIDSLKIRTKRLTDKDKKALLAAQDALRKIPLHVAYSIGASSEGVCEAMRELKQKNVRLVFVDYLQKMRNVKIDRRGDVAANLSHIQTCASELGMAVIFTSQVSRGLDPSKRLTIHRLKDSGDIENEARVILLLDRDEDSDILNARLAKCTFGGEGLTFGFARDKSGILKPVGKQELTSYADNEEF